MKIVERKNGRIEYYPDSGKRIVRRDRTVVYPWFLSLRLGESIEDYEEIAEEEAVQIEGILKEREGLDKVEQCVECGNE